MARIEPKTVTLKNKVNVILRTCQSSDAEKLPIFLEKIAAETLFTLQYPGKEVSVFSTRDRWDKALQDPGIAYLGAFIDNRIVGQLNFHREDNEHPWIRDTAQFAMFILKKFWGTNLA